MNWTDEEIDKLFQESASQMNVPYQDAFWNEMEALLPKKEKKKGLGWIFGGTLTCMALIAAMFFHSNPFSVSKTRVAKQDAALPAAPTQLPMTASVDNTQPESTNATASGSQANTSSVIENVQAAPARRIHKASDNVSGLVDHGAGKQDLLADLSSDATPQTAQPEPETADKLALLGLPAYALELVPFQSKFVPKAKRQAFYAQLGFGMTQSYVAGTENDWMPAINIGGGYQYRPEGFGFSAGINLSSTFGNNLQITRRSKVYNFGSTNYEQNFTYKQLYSLEMPVSIDFRKDRHTISLGLAPTYLVSTVMRFSQFENDQLSEDGLYVGQKVGLNSFGLKTGIGYQLEVAKSWNVGIQLNAQLVKQIDETQFVGTQTKLPLSGQITIRKTLTR